MAVCFLQPSYKHESSLVHFSKTKLCRGLLRQTKLCIDEKETSVKGMNWTLNMALSMFKQSSRLDKILEWFQTLILKCKQIDYGLWL